MIFDQLEHIGRYKGLGRGLDVALDFLKNWASSMDEAKEYELGQGVTARCAVYTPVPPAEGVTEAHRKYIDVMLMKEGGELIGYKPVGALQNITKEYDGQADALLAKEAEGVTLLPFNKGQFAVWFPQDAHMPGVSDDTTQVVKRVIVKVPVE